MSTIYRTKYQNTYEIRASNNGEICLKEIRIRLVIKIDVSILLPIDNGKNKTIIQFSLHHLTRDWLFHLN